MKLVALAAIIAALVVPSALAATPTLTGTVGPGFTITLKKGTAKVTKLKAGSYVIKVSDKSSIHNFRLKGPGVNKSTVGRQHGHLDLEGHPQEGQVHVRLRPTRDDDEGQLHRLVAEHGAVFSAAGASEPDAPAALFLGPRASNSRASNRLLLARKMCRARHRHVTRVGGTLGGCPQLRRRSTTGSSGSSRDRRRPTRPPSSPVRPGRSPGSWAWCGLATRRCG